MKAKVSYKVENKVFPPKLGEVELQREIGKRVDRFIYERVSGEFARKEILREAEEMFRDRFDDELYDVGNGYGNWAGEFWGKLIISAVQVCKLKQDPQLRETIRQSAYNILQYQTADGYLNTYRDYRNIMPADPEDTMKYLGWLGDPNYSVWCQKYTFWGLLEAAELLDDTHILTCAEKMAEQLMAVLEELQVRLKDTGICEGMCACSILKPILILYRLTGKKKYYQFALEIVKQWNRRDGEAPNLIRNALSGKPVAQWYPTAKTYPPEKAGMWSSKAYEMMSCYEGLCELYRIDGNEKYLNAVKGLYELLIQYESNILGSVGYCEMFFNAAAYPDAATEICDVIHWMRICYELFCLTGEPKYMESFEKAFVNAFLAGMHQDGKYGAFFIRSSGRHWLAEGHCNTKYQHCCVNNIPRGFCNAAEAAVMGSREGYYINSYIPTRVRFGDAVIWVKDGYIDSGAVTIHGRNLEVGKRLFLRIPEWSKNTLIRCMGAEYSAEAGTYFELSIEKPDFFLKIQFDITPRILDFAGEYRVLPENDYHIKRWTDNIGGPCDRGAMVPHAMSTVRRGPAILARSKRVGSKEEDMFSGKTIWGKKPEISAEMIRHDNLLCACDVTFWMDGENVVYRMCDYASAANQDLGDPRYFTVFV